MSVSGSFIGGGGGRILVVTHRPSRASNQALIVVPAFGDEMNKSRRLIWTIAQAVCEHGCWAFAPDLSGTGDSEGDFADARWEFWVDDLCRTVDWAREHGVTRFNALTVRLGAPLFLEAQRHMSAAFEKVVAWQPVHRGVDILKQLLRVRIVAVRMGGGDSEPLERLFEQLLEGPGPMELGGYEVSPELARAVAATTFSVDEMRSGDAAGLSLQVGTAAKSTRPNGEGLETSINRWKARRVPGEAFWNAIEPGPNPALVAETFRFLMGEQ